MRQTDDEEKIALQKVVNRLNAQSPAGMSYSMLELHTKAFPLVCLRGQTQVAEASNIDLHCLAARVPLTFDSMGRRAHEVEAESILEGME